MPSQNYPSTTTSIVEKVARESGLGGALINLAKSKVFNRVDYLYLVLVLKAAGFRPIFMG